MRHEMVSLHLAVPYYSDIYKLEISCDCGTPHIVPLDSSGHYEGPRPCDNTVIAVQVDPSEWRQIMKALSEKVTH